MNLLILALTSVLTLATLASADVKSIRAYCENEWPNDFRMQEYCYDQQIEAIARVKQLLQTAGIFDDNFKTTDKAKSPLGKALNMCIEKWKLPKFKTYDWRMVEYCIKNQIEAYERIHKQNFQKDKMAKIMEFRFLTFVCYFLLSSCIATQKTVAEVTDQQARVRNAYDFEVVNCRFIRELEAHITLFDHTYWKFVESEGPISHYGYAADTIHLRVAQNGGNTFVIDKYEELAGNKVYIQGKAYECPPQKRPIRRDSREMQL